MPVKIIEGQYNGKPNYSLDTKSMTDKESFIVEKVFTEGRAKEKPGVDGKPYVLYTCTVKYDDKDAALFFYEKDHDAFKECGGVGDRIKCEFHKEMVTYNYVVKGKQVSRDGVKKYFTFTKVE